MEKKMQLSNFKSLRNTIFVITHNVKMKWGQYGTLGWFQCAICEGVPSKVSNLTEKLIMKKIMQLKIVFFRKERKLSKRCHPFFCFFFLVKYAYISISNCKKKKIVDDREIFIGNACFYLCDSDTLS